MTYRVLHLEDSDLDADLVNQRLLGSELELRIDRVSDRRGFEAALGQPYDVILSDYQIPSFDGLAALEMARKAQPETPFVFVSGAMGEELAIETLKRGATDYVLKERLSRLCSVVERALSDRAAREALRRAEAEAEARLRESEDRFEFVRRSSGIGFWYCDLPFEVLRWDEFVKQHFFLPPDAAVTIDLFFERLHPDDRGPTRLAIERCIEAGTPYDVDYRTVDPVSGQTKWVRAIGRANYAADGAPIRFDGITVDITDRKRNEERIAQLLEKEIQHGAYLNRVAQASKALNVVLSVESVVRILTEEARTILRARQSAVSLGGAGLPTMNAVAVEEGFVNGFADPVRFEQTPLFVELMHATHPVRLSHDDLAAHPAWKQLRLTAKDDATQGGYLAAPLIGHGGNHLGFIQLSAKVGGDFSQEDESVLVQLAAIAATSIENARLYERLREQDQRKDEFLATLAHELRNPLAPIRTSLGILELAKTLDATIPTRKIMERQVGHMVRLIDDLLDVSRITRGKIQLRKERCDLRNVVDAAVEVSRPIIAAGQHQLHVSLGDEALWIDADCTRVSQIISNLLNNAAKYTPDGGRIELNAVRDGNQAVVRVRDSGVGISPEMLPRVFEMFTQVGRSLDRAQGGLGIGLALVRRLADMHGGMVTAASEGVGKGSTFCVRLPLVSPRPSAKAADGKTATKRTTTGPKRVLVVDDNVDAAESLVMLLELEGHRTATAHSGLDAIAAARAFKPQVVFLDIGLPGLNGYDVARALREMSECSGATLVAVTGWGTEDDRKQAVQSGFDHHLTKPVDLERLARLFEAGAEDFHER